MLQRMCSAFDLYVNRILNNASLGLVENHCCFWCVHAFQKQPPNKRSQLMAFIQTCKCVGNKRLSSNILFCCKYDKSNMIADHITYLFTQRYILKTAALFPKMIAKCNKDLVIRSSIMTTMPITKTNAYRITPSF